jgi:hypothetical protein
MFSSFFGMVRNKVACKDISKMDEDAEEEELDHE